MHVMKFTKFFLLSLILSPFLFINFSCSNEKKFKDYENFLKLHSYVIKFPKGNFIKAPLPEHFINFIKENKLDIDLEKVEKDFEKEFEYD